MVGSRVCRLLIVLSGFVSLAFYGFRGLGLVLRVLTVLRVEGFDLHL